MSQGEGGAEQQAAGQGSGATGASGGTGPAEAEGAAPAPAPGAPGSAADRRGATADSSWMLWATAGVVGVWVGVALVSVFAPDMVSGSEQQHLPLPAFTSWLWGMLATALYLFTMSRLRGRAERQPIWVGYAVAVLGIWLVATVVAIAAPVVETGSDPTRIPVAALVTPLASAILTGIAGIMAGIFSRPPR
jgi:hypothetical protein